MHTFKIFSWYQLECFNFTVFLHVVWKWRCALWKNEKVSQNFVKSTLVSSLVKTLLSRNISQKCVNVNISNFHIVNDSLTLRLKMCSFTKIAWNQLFYEGKLISRNIFLVKVLFLSTHIEFILRLWNSLSLLHFRSVLYYLWQFMAELCY